MTSDLLGQSYYKKALTRFKALELFMEEQDYSDVVREAQEIVELILKGILRKKGIEPPKLHDVGNLIIEHKDKLTEDQQHDTARIAEISKWLRKEREFSFYGDIDIIPTEEYSETDAARAIEDVRFVLEWAKPSFA
jgi:hypothetical protein